MKTLKYYNFDIIGLSEVNIHWTLVNPEESWEERISGHWEARKSVMACNPDRRVCTNKHGKNHTQVPLNGVRHVRSRLLVLYTLPGEKKYHTAGNHQI